MLSLAGAIVVCLVIGFCCFVVTAERSADAPAHADGLVVLTGGAERVETGLRLLIAGRADRLLVSGVARGLDLGGLARLAGVDPAQLAGRVTLDHEASSTRGNAAATAAWAGLHDVRSLIVITGYYHMPRALAELAITCPAVTLYRLPVVPPALRAHWLVGVRLLLEEYLKYLAVQSGVSRMLPADPGQRPVEAPASRA